MRVNLTFLFETEMRFYTSKTHLFKKETEGLQGIPTLENVSSSLRPPSFLLLFYDSYAVLAISTIKKTLILKRERETRMVTKSKEMG
jgi:hypothetical protein